MISEIIIAYILGLITLPVLAVLAVVVVAILVDFSPEGDELDNHL